MRKRSEHAVTMLRHSCRNLAAVVLLTAAFLLPVNALAQVPCGDHEKIKTEAAANYSEQPVAAGITTTGRAVIELLEAVDGSTWTLLAVYPHGGACIIAIGNLWQEITPRSLDPES